MQGFNMGRYHPPSALDPSLAPAAKRARTTKTWQTPAQPTIRFEMPFAIWCQTCPAHASARLIGQGVRFNARKTRVGAYHSTPVWAFELKHTACGGRIEIRTDPANHDFVVAEGARRRDHGDDAVVAERTGGMLVEGGGMVQSREAEERALAREDAFAAFEGKKVQKELGETMAKRLEALRSIKERDWRDPDEVNRRLRQRFRGVRRERDQDRERGEKLADTMGFGFELLEGSEADARRAMLVEFGVVSGSAGHAEVEPLFPRNKDARQAGKKLSSVQSLQQELSGNTRASLDPFAEAAANNTASGQSKVLQSIKKKNELGASATDGLATVRMEPLSARTRTKDSATGAAVSALVAYDSD